MDPTYRVSLACFFLDFFYKDAGRRVARLKIIGERRQQEKMAKVLVKNFTHIYTHIHIYIRVIKITLALC